MIEFKTIERGLFRVDERPIRVKNICGFKNIRISVGVTIVYVFT